MENKKKMIGLIIAIVVLLLIVVGATYAYFAAQLGTGAQTDVDITSESVDSLTFTTGDPISFKITQDNFKQGGNNLSGVTTATANLVAAKDTTAKYNYYVYLDINKNDFIYTTEEQTAELILSITKPDNTKITSIDGFDYVTVGGISGFDITESTDLIKIAENYEITTSSNIEQTWTVEIIFINLESNQSANAGRSIQSEVKIQKEKEEGLFAEYIKSLYTTDGENGLYLHDSDLENGANDGSLRYAGGDYKLTQKAIDAGYERINSNNYNEKNELINLYQKSEDGNYQERIVDGTAVAIPRYFLLKYNPDLHYDTFKETIDAGVKDGYLTKDNIKNYVCFGSDLETCPIDNLYRIIGVFGDKVKLIKYDYATTDLLGNNGDFKDNLSSPFPFMRGKGGNGEALPLTFVWNKNSISVDINGELYYNVWRISGLNKINLNTNYINNIEDKWASFITGINYKVGGITKEIVDSQNVKVIFENEIKNSNMDVETNYKGRVGLMYVSDYGFATNPNFWINGILDINIKNSNWLYSGATDSTITRRISTNGNNKNFIYSISAFGTVGGYNKSNSLYIRPAFYLSSGVKYVSGDGTESNPYRISK